MECMSRITSSCHFILEIECNLTCENDGICAKDHNDDLQCFCPQGYSGQYCEHGKRTSILDIPHNTQLNRHKPFNTLSKYYRCLCHNGLLQWRYLQY